LQQGILSKYGIKHKSSIYLYNLLKDEITLHNEPCDVYIDVKIDTILNEEVVSVIRELHKLVRDCLLVMQVGIVLQVSHRLGMAQHGHQALQEVTIPQQVQVNVDLNVIQTIHGIVVQKLV
jgi:hypothetical protein